jgi:hypothetical protein
MTHPAYDSPKLRAQRILRNHTSATPRQKAVILYSYDFEWWEACYYARYDELAENRQQLFKWLLLVGACFTLFTLIWILP